MKLESLKELSKDCIDAQSAIDASLVVRCALDMVQET